MNKKNISANNGPMLNAYPDSMGGTLGGIVSVLQKPEFQDVFSSFYILPSMFNTDLDRGFSVIDYSLNQVLASDADLAKIKEQGIDLKLDFILNHASVLSEQFQDIIRNGEQSKYKDFFINWNKFWEGHGTMTADGFIWPDAEKIKDMFFRKPGLPILMVRFPDGTQVPYWNTFYQEVKYPVLDAQDLMKVGGIQYALADGLAKLLNAGLAKGSSPAKILGGEAADAIHAKKSADTVEEGKVSPFAEASSNLLQKLTEVQKQELIDLVESRRMYLGQMDLNIKSPLVWEFYDDTLKTLSNYGAKIVRLDAFAYAPKEPGEKNFLNEPSTWDVLTRVRKLADKYQLSLLPEIHASYGDKIHEVISDKGYMTYDFFLPGLLIDAIESGNAEVLKNWANEILEKNILAVNMLGCHDGIPLLDLKGMIPEERIQKIIDIVVGRGGLVKDLHGQKNIYYQVNATYYSALGEDDKKMLLARAIQLFMPGKPQVWYLDLFAGTNDYEAVKHAGSSGHKEINRTNLSLSEIDSRMQLDLVQDQLTLLAFRAKFGAFAFDSKIRVESKDGRMDFTWEKDGNVAILHADLRTMAFRIEATDANGQKVFAMER